MSTTINFTVIKLASLKRAYAGAVRNKKKSFTFENDEFVTDYAKYLIEYLESKFKNKTL